MTVRSVQDQGGRNNLDDIRDKVEELVLFVENVEIRSVQNEK